jgi:hypothetical protein
VPLNPRRRRCRTSGIPSKEVFVRILRLYLPTLLMVLVLVLVLMLTACGKKHGGGY